MLVLLVFSRLGFSQFIGVEIHDRKAPVVHPFAAISVGLVVCAIGLRSGHGAAVDESEREHRLVTDDGGPSGEAFELDKEVVARLSINMGELGLGALPVQRLPLVTTSRLATIISALGIWRLSRGVLGFNIRIGRSLVP